MNSIHDIKIKQSSNPNPFTQGDSVEVDARFNCRTQFTQAGVNKFERYSDDKVGERVFKSGREGFVGWLGAGGCAMLWHPGHNIGFAYTCTDLAWWDVFNSMARKLQKETAVFTSLSCVKKSKRSQALKEKIGRSKL